ncbi:MAG: nitroreductase family deazaflavin-dependent oxidoreductase [Chloroflexaceae bacterium]|jgi:deazaflavin-dependent oxidoreductase (nitroreductase family)|nr:nitroreductase family deazaflavin-dependent oxidoreductase [Chloroflexaceae bacterium]
MNWHPLFERVLRALTNVHITLYRLLRGRVPGKFFGTHSILVTTMGRKSGKPRTTPLLFVPDGDSYIVVASYGGSNKHPAWYLNMEANPHVLVEAHGTSVETHASLVHENEYESLWARLVAIYPTYASYRRATTRRLPIVRLKPVGQFNAEAQRRGDAESPKR